MDIPEYSRSHPSIALRTAQIEEIADHDFGTCGSQCGCQIAPYKQASISAIHCDRYQPRQPF